MPTSIFYKRRDPMCDYFPVADFTSREYNDSREKDHGLVIA